MPLLHRFYIAHCNIASFLRGAIFLVLCVFALQIQCDYSCAAVFEKSVEPDKTDGLNTVDAIESDTKDLKEKRIDELTKNKAEKTTDVKISEIKGSTVATTANLRALGYNINESHILAGDMPKGKLFQHSRPQMYLCEEDPCSVYKPPKFDLQVAFGGSFNGIYSQIITFASDAVTQNSQYNVMANTQLAPNVNTTLVADVNDSWSIFGYFGFGADISMSHHLYFGGVDYDSKLNNGIIGFSTQGLLAGGYTLGWFNEGRGKLQLLFGADLSYNNQAFLLKQLQSEGAAIPVGFDQLLENLKVDPLLGFRTVIFSANNKHSFTFTGFVNGGIGVFNKDTTVSGIYVAPSVANLGGVLAFDYKHHFNKYAYVGFYSRVNGSASYSFGSSAINSGVSVSSVSGGAGSRSGGNVSQNSATHSGQSGNVTADQSAFQFGANTLHETLANEGYVSSYSYSQVDNNVENISSVSTSSFNSSDYPDYALNALANTETAIGYAIVGVGGVLGVGASAIGVNQAMLNAETITASSAISALTVYQNNFLDAKSDASNNLNVKCDGSSFCEWSSPNFTDPKESNASQKQEILTLDKYVVDIMQINNGNFTQLFDITNAQAAQVMDTIAYNLNQSSVNFADAANEISPYVSQGQNVANLHQVAIVSGAQSYDSYYDKLTDASVKTEDAANAFYGYAAALNAQPSDGHSVLNVIGATATAANSISKAFGGDLRFQIGISLGVKF